MELVESGRRLGGEGRGARRKVVEGDLDGERTIAHELEIIGKAGCRTRNLVYEAFDMEREVFGGDLKDGDDVIKLLIEDCDIGIEGIVMLK